MNLEGKIALVTGGSRGIGRAISLTLGRKGADVAVNFLGNEAAARNHGKIVNVSSIAGKMGGTLGVHYAASKAGLIGMTFALASELVPLVTVNAVAPGPVDTDLISDEVKERLSKVTPMGRIATPEEIAHAVICLLENDFISGEAVNINGARYMD